VKTPLLATSLLALSAFLAVPAANAASIIHDSVGEFASITGNQGQATNNSGGNTQFTAVSAARSVLANMFDGDLNTAYSLGLGGTGAGGTLELVISPTTNFITGGSVVEWTFQGTNHAERAIVSLGLDGGGYVEIGEIFNTETGTSAGVIDYGSGVATLMLGPDPSNAHTNFVLTVSSGVFNTLKLQDNSPFLLGRGGTKSRDGFDVAELSITSNDGVVIAEPVALALFGAGLLGLGLARRRRA
jgi:hypothetical protein